MGLSVLMVPLYLQNIPIADYSAWLVSGNILAWLSAADPGLTLVLQQKIASSSGEKDLNKIGNLVFSGLVLAAVVFLIIIIVGITITYFLPNLLSQYKNIDLAGPFLISVIGTALMIFSFTIFSINQGLLSIYGVGILGIVSLLSQLILTTVLILNGLALYSISYGILLAGVINVGGQLYYLFKYLNQNGIILKYNFFENKNILNSLGHSFFGRAAGIISNNLDLIIISHFVNPLTLLSYTMSKKAIDISRGFIEQPILALLPSISHLLGAAENKKAQLFFSKQPYLLIWLLSFICFGFFLFNKQFISLWLGSNYFIGDNINLFICCSFFLSTISSVFQNYSYSLGSIKTVSIVNIMYSILYLSILFLLLNNYGIIGAPLATIISLCMLPLWFFPNHVFKKMGIESLNYHQLIREVLIIIICFILLVYLKTLFNFSIITFSSLFLSVFIYLTFYFVFLFLFSKNFRSIIQFTFTNKYKIFN
jgi:O-antigen/teichoic acid export membrane protein